MRRNFLTGLVILIPIAVTLIVVTLLVDLLTQPFLQAVEQFIHQKCLLGQSVPFVSSPKALKIWSQIFILISLFGTIYLLGLFARWFIFKTLIKLGDKIIHRIPIVNKLYKTVKEVIKVILTSDTKTFKQVVMVAFPNPNVFSIGFLSRDVPKDFNKKTSKELISVFIPTTPNPTTGYLLQFPVDEIKDIDMTIEEALKFIVSCGMVSPKEIHSKFLKEEK